MKDREVLEKKTVSLSDMWCQKKDNCDIPGSEICIFNSLKCKLVITLYTLTSLSKFSKLFSTHFICYWQGEFV